MVGFGEVMVGVSGREIATSIFRKLIVLTRSFAPLKKTECSRDSRIMRIVIEGYIHTSTVVAFRATKHR